MKSKSKIKQIEITYVDSEMLKPYNVIVNDDNYWTVIEVGVTAIFKKPFIKLGYITNLSSIYYKTIFIKRGQKFPQLKCIEYYN